MLTSAFWIAAGRPDLAGEQAEPFDLGIVGPSGNENADIRSRRISPVALRLQSEHPTGALPTVADLTANPRALETDQPYGLVRGGGL
jgi:hypothetical protein